MTGHKRHPQTTGGRTTRATANRKRGKVDEKTDSISGSEHEQPLKDGAYKVTLESIERRDTSRGEGRLREWRFRTDEHGTEVVGWTPRRYPSRRSKAYLWATALNPAVGTRRCFGPSDVVGRTCVLVVQSFKRLDGGGKYKILKVKPSAE